MARTPPDNQGPAPSELRREAVAAGARLDDGQADRLARWLALLMRWNKALNLVGPSNWREVVRALLPDSFRLPAFLDALSLPAAPRCLDFGAGAGVPGVPLRILWPRGELHLVEPRQKRAIFLQRSVAEAGLARTFIHQLRVQDLPDDLAGADVIIAKAFMPWPEYAALAREWIGPRGVVVVLASHAAPGPEKLAGKAPGMALVREESWGEAGRPRYCFALTPARASS